MVVLNLNSEAMYIKKKGEECNEKSACFEQGQPQGRQAHQRIARHNVLQSAVTSVAAAWWREDNQNILSPPPPLFQKRRKQ